MKKNMCLKRWDRRNSSVVRFAVISDVHIQDTTFTLDMAMDAFHEIGKMDGLLMVGDIVYQDGYEVEAEKYDIVLNRVRAEMPGVPFVYTVGNHEFPILAFQEKFHLAKEVFEEKTGQPIRYHTMIAGYHFITDISLPVDAGPDIGWIEQMIKEAKEENAHKPIFLMLHDAFTKLYYMQKEYRSDWMQSLRTVLQKYPQVIVLSGHSHIALQCPNVIFQEGFTAVQVPCLGEIGYIGGDELFEEFSIPGNPQAMLLEIEDNVVYIYKLDLEAKEYIGEPFVIDIPGLVQGTCAYQYTDKRKTDSNVPYFKKGSLIDVRKLRQDSVEIRFPKAYNDSMNEFIQDGFVIAYRVEVFEEMTKECIFSENVIPDFYKVGRLEDVSEYLEKVITGLCKEYKYEVKVTPISPFRKEGEPIRRQIEL